jgi:hypothetical protein
MSITICQLAMSIEGPLIEHFGGGRITKHSARLDDTKQWLGSRGLLLICWRRDPWDHDFSSFQDGTAKRVGPSLPLAYTPRRSVTLRRPGGGAATEGRAWTMKAAAAKWPGTQQGRT